MKIKMALYGVLLLSALPVFSQNKLMEKTAPLLFSTSSPYDSFGVLMRTNSGTIINFYREGTDHTTAGVGIIRTSTNNGSSWSYYSGTRYGSAGSCANSGCFYAASSPTEVQNVNGGCSPTTGTCVLFIGLWNGSSTYTIYYSRCTDGIGAVWSTPTLLSGYSVPTNENMVFVPGGGASSACPTGCMIEAVLDNGGSFNAYLLFSTDDGITFASPSSIIPGVNGTEEVGLGWISGNKLLGFVRPNQGSTPGTAPMMLVSTNDMGVTWTNVNTNIDVSPKPCCNWIGVPFTGTLTFYQMLSPWIVNQGLSSGQWTVVFGERQAWNSSNDTVYSYIRAISFDPTKAAANPASFSYGQVFDFRPIDSWVSSGYPSAAQTTDANHLLVQFNTEKTFAGAVQLFTANVQYVNNGWIQIQ